MDKFTSEYLTYKKKISRFYAIYRFMNYNKNSDTFLKSDTLTIKGDTLKPKVSPYKYIKNNKNNEIVTLVTPFYSFKDYILICDDSPFIG